MSRVFESAGKTQKSMELKKSFKTTAAAHLAGTVTGTVIRWANWGTGWCFRKSGASEMFVNPVEWMCVVSVANPLWRGGLAKWLWWPFEIQFVDRY